MKFAAVYCVYDDERWLPLSVASIYDSCDSILLLVGENPWNGPPTGNQATLRTIKAISDPSSKISLLQKSWKNEVEQRNYGLAVLQHAAIDYCFIVDADEIYDPQELGAMMQHARSQPDIGCWRMRWYTYWKSACFRINPVDPYLVPVFLRVGYGLFSEARNPKASSHGDIPTEIGMCHHMSYARSDSEIRKKISSFSHAHQIVPGWYENKWKAWDRDHSLQDLHPVNPPDFKQTVEVTPDQLPVVLREKASLSPITD